MFTCVVGAYFIVAGEGNHESWKIWKLSDLGCTALILFFFFSLPGPSFVKDFCFGKSFLKTADLCDTRIDDRQRSTYAKGSINKPKIRKITQLSKRLTIFPEVNFFP